VPIISAVVAKRRNLPLRRFRETGIGGGTRMGLDQWPF
jgi:hypothetical protein